MPPSPSDLLRPLTSAQIRQLVPEFVDADYPTFIAFMQAYYRWLEETGQIDDRKTRLLSYRDIDTTLDAFLVFFRQMYLSHVPQDAAVAPQNFVRYARELYQSKGSHESVKLLFRLIYGLHAEVYFPRKDILRSSDGDWHLDTTIKVRFVEGIDVFAGKTIVGDTSGAKIFVDTLSIYIEGASQIAELVVRASSGMGTFQIGETVHIENDTDGPESVVLGMVVAIRVDPNNAGQNYKVGDRVEFSEGLLGGGGTGASAEVSEVANDGLGNILIVDPGEGYVVGDPLQFINAGTGGSGATGFVSAVSPGNILAEDGDFLTIQDESGLEFRLRLEDVSYYLTSLTITDFLTLQLDATNYDTVTNHALANANISSLFSVTEGGVLNPFLVGGVATPYGRITAIQITARGSGYEVLPQILVTNQTAIDIEANTGIDIYHPAILQAQASSGRVKSIKMTSFGSGYVSPPQVSLLLSGDGSANLTAVIGTMAAYTGYYVGTYGQLSSDKKLQDADYYQPYSYVIRVEEDINRYRDVVKRLIHPAGSVFFGERLVEMTSNVGMLFSTTLQIQRIVAGQTDLIFVLPIVPFQVDSQLRPLVDMLQVVNMGSEFRTGSEYEWGEHEDMILPYANDAISTLQNDPIGDYHANTAPLQYTPLF